MFTCKLGNLSKRQGLSKSHDAEDMWFLPDMKWKYTTWIWNNPTGVPTRPKWQVISRMAQLFRLERNKEDFSIVLWVSHGFLVIVPLFLMVFPWDVPMTYPEELAQAKARCWDAVFVHQSWRCEHRKTMVLLTGNGRFRDFYCHFQGMNQQQFNHL